MKRIGLLLWSLLLTAPALPAGEDDSRRFQATSDGTVTIALTTSRDRETLWFLEKGESGIPVQIYPRVYGWEVETLHVSPDFRHVAVVAVSEGHTVLTLFLTADLLAGDPDSSGLRPFYILNPYPGDVFSRGWTGDNTLLIHQYDEDGRRKDLQLDVSESPVLTPIGKS